MPAASGAEHVPCANCGGTSTRRVYRKYDLDLVRCRSCRLVYASPRAATDAIWGRYSRTYFWNEYLPSLGVHDGRFDLQDFDARHAAMLRRIAAYVPPPGRMFEVGVGAGFFLKAAERAGWTTGGVELSQDAVQFATGQLGLAVSRGSAETAALPPASQDVIVMFETIEHLLDPREVVSALRRALCPGGLLVVSTPNFDALSRAALGQQWAVISPLEHLYYFTEGTLRSFLESSGFTDVRFIRQFENWGPLETMNFRYTNAPGAWRSKLYGAGVMGLGRHVFRRVQRWGFADTLLCFARTARG